ncbi:MAG: hypothetical protein ABI779_11930 [Acidobacteriota bacterium]
MTEIRQVPITVTADTRRPLSVWAFVLVWALSVAGGLMIFNAYQNRQGPRGAVPRSWPAESRILRSPDSATLLVFLHPNCPCSRASVHSLQRITGSLPPSSLPRIVFVIRKAVTNDWRAKSLLADASATPNATLLNDVNEEEIARFGTQVSGHALLYDHEGHLLFDGGLTAERGQEGDSVAADRLHALLGGTTTSATRTAVFGCALRQPVAVQGKGASCPAS